MQISGSKAWRVYGTAVETPFRGERFELGRHEAGEVTQEFTLNAGDCLYLPRGIMHDAENVGDEPSLHITVGLITKTWADLLLESISELALDLARFPPLAARRLCQSRLRPREGARPFRQARSSRSPTAPAWTAPSICSPTISCAAGGRTSPA